MTSKNKSDVGRITGADQEAIEASIAHWERIFEGDDHEINTDHCALCHKYYGKCSECPLKKYFSECRLFTKDVTLDNPWGLVREGLLANYIPTDLLKSKRKDIAVMLMCLYFLREIHND